jgi:hypothetical protein
VIKSALFVACAGVLCLAAASDAAADPIRVLSGSLVFPDATPLQTGPMSLLGTRGFSLIGGIDTRENNVGPFTSGCFPCPPSSTVDIGGPSVSNAGFFNTTLTFEGETFVNVGFSETALLILQLHGTVAVPELGPSPIVLTAPFTLDGYFQPGRFVDSVPIRGGGLVTLRLAQQFGFGWDLQSIRYDFVATPTPEPAPLLLIGGGLAAVALRVRRNLFVR